MGSSNIYCSLFMSMACNKHWRIITSGVGWIVPPQRAYCPSPRSKDVSCIELFLSFCKVSSCSCSLQQGGVTAVQLQTEAQVASASGQQVQTLQVVVIYQLYLCEHRMNHPITSRLFALGLEIGTEKYWQFQCFINNCGLC